MSTKTNKFTHQRGRPVLEYRDVLTQHLIALGLSAANNRSEVYRTLKRFIKYYDTDDQCAGYLLRRYGLDIDRPDQRFNLYIQLNRDTGEVLNVRMPDNDGTMRRFPPGPSWSGVVWPVNPWDTGQESIKRTINRQWNGCGGQLTRAPYAAPWSTCNDPGWTS